MKKFIAFAFLCGALVIGGLLMLSPGRGESVQIDVLEGSTAHKISEELVSRGLLDSRWPFIAWVRLRDAGQKIHVGRYQFAQGRSAYWIVDDLIQGRTQKIRVVIPEGFASWQIAERLAAAGICDGPAFLQVVREKKLEGYLFPATYDFEAGLRASSVADRLKSKFEDTWTDEMYARAREIGFTREEVVALASIVEREVRVHDEGPLVSAVYHNRLRKGMKLEADPTVQFAKGEWVTRLTYADYRNTVSPYNTYRVKGLPPGPICSPGLNSLKAALWPADSKALFFVAVEDGRHSFSETYREHTNKVNKRNRERRNKK